MITCPACGHENADENEECENCGVSFVGSGSTVVFSGDQIQHAVKAQKGWRSAEVGDSHNIKLHFEGDFETVHLPPGVEVTIGRDDPNADQRPDVDLSVYGAATNGVSRIHAALRFESGLVQVRDNNSTNGTFVNGQSVGGTEWRILRDSDELTLGTLILNVYFDET